MGRISDDPVATDLDGAVVPIVQGGLNKQAPAALFGSGDAVGGFINRIINGDGRFNNRAASSIADDAYGHDCHYALTQTATITVSTLTDVADGLPRMWRLSQSQASAQRMGYAHIVESILCKSVRGSTATLLGKLRCSASQPIRYAILEWTGTADAVTSDVVNSWTNGTFTAGQFFNSTSITVAAVGAITPGAAALTDFALTATLSGSVNNVIVLMWTEGTAAQNVTLDGAWELLPGDFSSRTYPVDRPDPIRTEGYCQRYFARLQGVTGGDRFVTGQWQNGTSFGWAFSHPVPFRTAPSIAVNDMTVRNGNGVAAVITVTGASISWTKGLFTGVTFTAASGGVVDYGSQVRFNTSGSYIDLDASL